MSKRFYILMFLTLSLTIVILSASYAKDSGVSTFDSYRVSKDNLVVTYDNSTYAKVVNVTDINNYKNIDGYKINVVNKSDSLIKYDIEVICDDCINKVYYSVNDSNPKLISDKVIYSSNLDIFGKDGDLEEYLIKFISLDKKYDGKIKIVVSENSNILMNKIIKNKDTKMIGKDYVLYSENNYIKYDNNVYRIIGIINNKVKIFDTLRSNVGYSANNNYMDEDLLLKIYYVKDIKDIANKESWLDSYGDFWLKGNKEFVKKNIENAVGISNESVVLDIDGDLEIIAGDGSMNAPYEVNYES